MSDSVHRRPSSANHICRIGVGSYGCTVEIHFCPYITAMKERRGRGSSYARTTHVPYRLLTYSISYGSYTNTPLQRRQKKWYITVILIEIVLFSSSVRKIYSIWYTMTLVKMFRHTSTICELVNHHKENNNPWHCRDTHHTVKWSSLPYYDHLKEPDETENTAEHRTGPSAGYYLLNITATVTILARFYYL